MIRIGSSGLMFLLALHHPDSPGQTTESHKTVVCVCVCYHVGQFHFNMSYEG